MKNWQLRPIYSYTTPIDVTLSSVELSCVAIDTLVDATQLSLAGDRQCNWPSCSVQPISAKQVSRVELSYVAINGPLVSKVGSHLNGLTFFVSVSNGYMLRDRVDGRVALTLRDRLLFGGNGTSWGTCIRNRNWLSLSIVLANTQLSLQPSLQRVPQFFGYGTLNNILWSAKHITQYNWH